VAVELSQRQLAQGGAGFAHAPFHFLKPAPESLVGAVQGQQWVDPQMAGQVDRREQQVAQFLLRAPRLERGRLIDLGQLFGHLREDRTSVVPVEPDGRRGGLQIDRVAERTG